MRVEQLPVQLSSTLTAPIRLFCLALVSWIAIGLIALALSDVRDEGWTIGNGVIVLCAVAVAVLGIPFFDFAHVTLSGTTIEVRRGRQSWRVPTRLVESVADRDYILALRLWGGLNLVSVRLRQRIPGLGWRIRYVGRVVHSPIDGAAEALLGASEDESTGA